MPVAMMRGARAAHVYSLLRERIVRGDLAPGTRVVETDMAEQMGVGRTPMREALQLLLKEGLLVATEGGRRLLTVAPLRADDVTELFPLLADLETAALRALDRLSDAERGALVEAMRDANQAFREVVRRVPVDLDAAFTTHQAFHASLTDPLAGPWLAWMLELVRPQVGRYEWVYGALLEGSLEVAADEHDAIVRAVEAGDAEAEAAALRENWSNAGTRLRAAIHRTGRRRAG